jgi:uncharacterized protein
VTGATNALAALLDPAEAPRAADADLGGWMQTRSAKAYHFEHPQQSSIVIGDIAHALSNICRYGGHSRAFYSVAEHSVLVSLVVEKTHPEHAFAALMHDATEAYVGDVPRPLKALLGRAYAELEKAAWLAICRKFGINPFLHECVKAADNAVLLAEKDVLLDEPPIPWTWAAGLTPADVAINCWIPRVAKMVFIDRFRELRERLA